MKAPALALSAVLALAACKGEEEEKSTNTNENAATEQSAETPGNQVSLIDQYLLALDIPATRDGEEFTVSVNAYCNKVEKDADYVENCTQAATDYIQEGFMCKRAPIAPAAVRINNQEIVERGLTGNYREFPTQYLYTQEELEEDILANNKRFNKDNFFVITDIDNLDAASVTYFTGEPPQGPLCD